MGIPRRLAPSTLGGTMLPKWFWLAALAGILALVVACTLDNPESPELTGPSALGRSVEVRAVPDQLISDGFSNSIIEAVLRGPNSERIPGAEIYFDIEGFVDLGNLTPLNQKQPPSVLGAEEATAVFATTSADGVARARYWAPFRTDQPNDRVVTILARETKTDFRQNIFGKADIFLRAADRPIPGPIPAPSPNCPTPSASLELSQLCSGGEIQSGRPIQAVGVGSDAGDQQTIINFLYNWGDGTTDSTRSSSASHTYSRSLEGFDVTISLTVVNSCGASSSASQTASVVDAATCVPLVCPTPSAAFSTSATCAAGEILADGARVTLFDASTSSSGDPAFPITSYSWSFGDGSTGTGVTSSNMYAAALAGSSASVNMTVTNSCGATATTSTSFVLVDPCP